MRKKRVRDKDTPAAEKGVDQTSRDGSYHGSRLVLHRDLDQWNRKGALCVCHLVVWLWALHLHSSYQALSGCQWPQALTVCHCCPFLHFSVGLLVEAGSIQYLIDLPQTIRNFHPLSIITSIQKTSRFSSSLICHVLSTSSSTSSIDLYGKISRIARRRLSTVARA